MAGRTARDATPGSSFEYQPLDRPRKSIRLLTLDAGAKEDNIRCSMRTEHLDDDTRPKYETISYAWGDSPERKDILVNGRYLAIPVSAEAALRCMRRRSRRRVLWIDSVCINQSDAREKGHQVAMMADVYSRGTGNLIYLGEADVSTEIALKDVRSIMSMVPAPPAPLTRSHEMDHYWDSIRRLRYKVVKQAIADVNPLLSIFKRDWFKRLWVLQELYLSPKNSVSIGDYRCSLRDLLLAASAMMKHGRNIFVLQPPSDFWTVMNSPLLMHLLLMTTPEGSFSLFHTLWLSRSFLTRDIRDKIYGLVGICQILYPGIRIRHSPLEPDYTKPPADVFRDATKYMIRTDDDLDCLIYGCRGAVQGDLDGPSWCTAWYQPSSHEHNISGLRSRFKTCLDLCATPPADSTNDPNVLSLTGMQIDTVAECSGVIYSDGQSNAAESSAPEVSKVLAQVQELIDRTKQLRPDGADTLLNTLVTGEGDRFTKRSGSVHSSVIQQWLEYVETNLAWVPNTLSDEDASKLHQFQDAMLDACRRRRCFATASGRVGLGHWRVQAGDAVVILGGGKWPFMLRRVEKPYRTDYQLVAPAYIHDVMYGEAVEEYRRQGKAEKVFNLV